MKVRREVCACALGWVLVVGCSKSDPGTAAPSGSAAAPATISATPPATVVAPVAPAADSASEAPVAVASATGGKSPPVASPGGSAAAPKTFTCGNKGQPNCPTQAWMKANMATAAASGDGPDLAKGLDYIAAHAPAGMPSWSGIARGGAAKAKAGDIDGAKASCKSCHDQYKAKYKAEVRDRPF